MLRLNLNPEAEWLELAGGVSVLIEPATTAIMAAARNDPLIADLAEDASNETRGIAMAKAVGKIAVLDWQGVGDETGEPVAPSPERIEALLDVYPIFERFQVQYMHKALVLEQEKNGSAPSPSGTTAGARNTAKPAGTSAKSARKGSTSRKAGKGTRSGT